MIRRITWSLFGLACLFVGARFVARPERLHGSGYGEFSSLFLISFSFSLLSPLTLHDEEHLPRHSCGLLIALFF